MISHSFSVTFPVNVVSLNVERCNTVQKMARQLGFDNASDPLGNGKRQLEQQGSAITVQGKVIYVKNVCQIADAKF